MSPGIRIRTAVGADAPQLAGIDALAVAGDKYRQASIRNWIADGTVQVAEVVPSVVGYCVVECTFFEQSFMTMLMVAEQARCQGVGARLLRDAEQHRRTPKLFTSTNLSNHPMQRLLARRGWRSAGIVYGLDEDDPELFFRAPQAS